MAHFNVNLFIIARENSCKIGRAPYGVRLIFYNAGRAPYADAFIYRRRTAPVRYVTTQEKVFKNRPVPGRLSNSPVKCTLLKSYDVSFICDHSINLHTDYTPLCHDTAYQIDRLVNLMKCKNKYHKREDNYTGYRSRPIPLEYDNKLTFC